MGLSPRTLRPANNFTPRSITGLALWLDASDASTLFQDAAATTPATATSDPVGAWLDKSGNARHLTQATSAARPSLLTNGISSKPALNFDGTDDTIWRQPGLTSDDLSILMVHQTNFMSGGVTYEFTHSGDTTNSQATNLTGFGNVAGFQVGANGSPTYMCDVTRSFTNVDLQGRSGTAGDVTANVPALSTQCVSYSASTSAIRKQAWTSGKGMLNSARFNCGGWSAVTLGSRRNNLAAGGINSPSVFLSGRIAEVIAYSRYITDTERRRLELYLARKWSVTLTGAPTVSNAEAQDWIDRVYGNGGSVSSATAAAVNDFCNAIDSAGIRDRFYRLNLFCGGTSGTTAGLAACLTPLYTGPTPLGIKYGNATDTNVGPFVVGDYAENAGLTGNGSSKYLNTGLTVSNIGTAANGHMAVYHGLSSGANSNRYYMGANDATTSNRFYLGTDAFSTASVFGSYGATQNASQTLAAQGHGPAGHRILSRESDSLLTHYHNGSVVATNTTTITPAVSTAAFAVFAANRNGTVDRFHNSWIAAYSIGLGLNSTQAANYRTIMQTFQAALGRNV